MMDEDLLLSAKDSLSFTPCDWDEPAASSYSVGAPARWLVNQDDFVIADRRSPFDELFEADGGGGASADDGTPLSATSTPTKSSDSSASSPASRSPFSPADEPIKLEPKWDASDAGHGQLSGYFAETNAHRQGSTVKAESNASHCDAAARLGDAVRRPTALPMGRPVVAPYFVIKREPNVAQWSCKTGVTLSRPRRSRTHQLAVQAKLISDQDLRTGAVSPLALSHEEQRALRLEGFAVPTRLPLNKHQVEALKIVRRKIKNKLSAQESRRKRKEYVESMEEKMRKVQVENSELRERLRQLERGRHSLTAQLEQVKRTLGTQAAHSGGSGSGGKAVAVLALLLSLSIVSPATMTSHYSTGAAPLELAPSHGLFAPVCSVLDYESGQAATYDEPPFLCDTDYPSSYCTLHNDWSKEVDDAMLSI